MFQQLTQNFSSAGQSLASTLLNDQHRYLLLKYFDNERVITVPTIGPQELTITNAALPAGSTSATLTTAWTLASCQQLTVFSDGEQQNVNYTQGSTAISWNIGTTAVQTSDALSTMGCGTYSLPANVSKVKNNTITIGQLVYTNAPIHSIQEWTRLNALPYNSSIPAFFFVYERTMGIWPIPADTGSPMTIYAQIRVPDLSYADYTTGTISTMSVGSNTITLSGSTLSSEFPLNTDLAFANLYFIAQPPSGDGYAYPIQSFASDTTVTLQGQVLHAPATGGTFLIGQYPVLSDEFHDAICYGALRAYYGSVNKDTDRYNLYNTLFGEKTALMNDYLSTRQLNVDLSPAPATPNPNLFYNIPI